MTTDPQHATAHDLLTDPRYYVRPKFRPGDQVIITGGEYVFDVIATRHLAHSDLWEHRLDGGSWWLEDELEVAS